MLKKIGVQNFRVFKDYTEFEIRPITLLIGPNNSGKSSFPKLLLLLKNGLGLLDFKKGKHNLEDFEKVLNWKNNQDELRIKLNAIFPFFKDVEIEYYYKNSKISRILISKENRLLMEYSINIEGPNDDWMFPGSYTYQEKYCIHIENLIEIIYEGKFHIVHEYFTGDGFEEDWINPNQITFEFESFEGERVSMLNIDRTNYMHDHNIDAERNLLAGYAIKNEVTKLKKDHLLFILFINGEDRTTEFEVTLRRLQKKYFEDINSGNIHINNITDFDILSNFVENISNLFEEESLNIRNALEESLNIKNVIKDAFKKYGSDNVVIEISPLGQILFQEKWFNHHHSDGKSGQTIFSQLGSFDFEFSKIFAQLDYLSANRGNQRRVLQNESEVEIDKIVADYAARDNKNLGFIEKAFSIMGIEGTLVPVRYENTISVLYIEQDDKRISLADLGFGFSQLIPIFLKIIMSKNLLIIEEPEANLHPDLQSKLADLLNLAIQSFPDKRFVIETHSEYLIRKMQYLTAKKELQPEQSVIYYFNADKYVSREEPKVKRIEITPTGNLTDTFGPGFYDEATRLKFDLMNINREQNN